MADGLKRQLSGWRVVALLPLAAAALVAACASDPLAEEYEYFLERARQGEDLSDRSYYEEFVEIARMDEDISEEEFNMLFGPPVPPPAVLLNDPPPPIHTGGEPYPPGTFPPELARFWRWTTNYIRQPAAIWSGGTADISEYIRFFERDPVHPLNPQNEVCSLLVERMPSGYFFVEDQLIFTYGEALDDPQATIEAELSAAGVVYESITVRTGEYYDEQYDPEAFYNWLSPDNSRYDQLAVLERLGAELHPNARAFTREDYYKFWAPEDMNMAEIEGMMEMEDLSPMIRQETKYQVRLHGFTGDVRDLRLQNGRIVQDFQPACAFSPDWVTQYLLQGVYTTFGDDVVFVIDHDVVVGKDHQPDLSR